MLKPLFLIFFGLLSLGAQASSPVLAATVLARPQPASGSPDTLRAISRMYARHRAGGGVWATIGGALTGSIAGGLASGNSSGDSAGGVVSIVVLGGGPLGIGIGKLVRFSGARQAEVEKAYESCRPLPPGIRRRLKQKDFR